MRIYAQAIISSFAVSPNLDPDVNCQSELRSHLQVFAALTHQTPETMNPTHHKSGLQQILVRCAASVACLFKEGRTRSDHPQ